MVTWRRYIAIGDSFSEGLSDLYPDGSGYRGWADLVAYRLNELQLRRAPRSAGPDQAELPGEALRYANLAVRGLLFEAVVARQVPTAINMCPDLVTFGAGGNDILRPRIDIAGLLATLDQVVQVFRKAGADVVLFCWMDISHRLPRKATIKVRLDQLNRGTAEIADRYGARLVDMWHDETFHNLALWNDDRLHLSPVGHQYVAGLVLDALGADTYPGWPAVPPAPTMANWGHRRLDDLTWTRKHLAPWVKRRILGQSSAVASQAKRPELAIVECGLGASQVARELTICNKIDSLPLCEGFASLWGSQIFAYK